MAGEQGRATGWASNALPESVGLLWIFATTDWVMKTVTLDEAQGRLDELFEAAQAGSPLFLVRGRL
jgi:hypothetical protein